jgi:hypothetical protein
LNAGIVGFCPINLRVEAGFNRSVAVDVLGSSFSFKLLPILGSSRRSGQFAKPSVLYRGYSRLGLQQRPCFGYTRAYSAAKRSAAVDNQRLRASRS